MSYPNTVELLQRDNLSMDWDEYGAYLSETEYYLSEQQALILANDAFKVHSDEELADILDTTTQTINSQRGKINLDSIPEPTYTELVSTPWPATPFIYAGEFHDWFPEESDARKVDIFVSIEEDETIVAEKIIEKEEQDEDTQHLKANMICETTNLRLWESLEVYLENSEFSPLNIDKDEENDLHSFKGIFTTEAQEVLTE